MDISDTTSPAAGGKKIILLCERVSRDDIKVKFYDDVGWEAYAEFNPSDVHKQYAIAFKTPRYKVRNRWGGGGRAFVGFSEMYAVL